MARKPKRPSRTYIDGLAEVYPLEGTAEIINVPELRRELWHQYVETYDALMKYDTAGWKRAERRNLNVLALHYDKTTETLAGNWNKLHGGVQPIHVDGGVLIEDPRETSQLITRQEAILAVLPSIIAIGLTTKGQNHYQSVIGVLHREVQTLERLLVKLRERTAA